MVDPGKNIEASNKNIQSQATADRILEGMFLVGVAGVSLLFGFGRSFATVRNREKIVDPTVVNRMEGSALALRALGWGSLIAVTGVGAISFGIWKAMGVRNMQEFREKVGNFLPRIPRKENPGSRTQFENLTELFQYIIDEDNKSKMKKTEAPQSTEINQDSR